MSVEMLFALLLRCSEKAASGSMDLEPRAGFKWVRTDSNSLANQVLVRAKAEVHASSQQPAEQPC